jgi:hypothetical protein
MEHMEKDTMKTNDEPHRIMKNVKEVLWEDFVSLVFGGKIFAMKVGRWYFIDVAQDVAYDLSAKILRDRNCSQRILLKEEFNKTIQYVDGVWIPKRQVFDTEETGEMLQGMDGYDYPDTRELKTYELRDEEIILLSKHAYET